MVHPFNANSADVAVAGPGRAVDIAGEAELYPVDFERLGEDVRDLNVRLDVLVFGDEEEFFINFVFLVLYLSKGYYFLNYSWLLCCNVNIDIKVYKLQHHHHSHQPEVVLGSEPAQVQDLVQADRGLDED